MTLHHNSQQNDTQHKDNHCNVTQNEDAQLTDIQHNGLNWFNRVRTLSIMTLGTMTFNIRTLIIMTLRM